MSEACPRCGSPVVPQHEHAICPRCHRIVESCCEGSGCAVAPPKPHYRDHIDVDISPRDAA